jgi:hypothetical protein
MLQLSPTLFVTITARYIGLTLSFSHHTLHSLLQLHDLSYAICTALIQQTILAILAMHVTTDTAQIITMFHLAVLGH